MDAGGHFVQKKLKKSLSKVIFGHPKWPFCPNFKQIIKIRMDLKWPEMPSKVNFGHPIWPIDQKWPEMRSKVIFGHPKLAPKKTNKILYRSEMARIAIESEYRKSKMANRSEMARNTIENEFRTSKMTDGSHFLKNFQKKFKFRIDLKWPEM